MIDKEWYVYRYNINKKRIEKYNIFNHGSFAKDIENIINMLDGKVAAGTSRINLNVSDGVKDGEVREVHHHGRCDVGSAWAKGTVKNPECVDIPNTDAIDK